MKLSVFSNDFDLDKYLFLKKYFFQKDFLTYIVKITFLNNLPIKAIKILYNYIFFDLILDIRLKKYNFLFK